MSNSGPIPNRWLRCPRKASGLIANKFLAIKTPLDAKFNSKVDLPFRFYPDMVFKTPMYKNKIGLWIDLTNTTRYYNKKDIENESCKYFKLDCRGHGETPTEEQTSFFIRYVDQFIKYQPLKLIVVHCTHGFNRTGFLLVSYLIEMCDCSLESALSQFAHVRSPGIYKQDYIEELYRRYDSIENVISAPPLPDWCFDYDENDVKPSHEDSSTDTLSSNQDNGDTDFMVKIKGIYRVKEQDKVRQLQKVVKKMCRGAGGKDSFPGSQPVSMTCNNIKFLSEYPYRVSWKADGTRYMMLIDNQDEVYFLDRKFYVFKVDGVIFPKRNNPNDSSGPRHLTKTLLDGEMVIDRDGDKEIPRYLIYDIVYLNNEDVGGNKFYPTRLSLIRNEIIEPRHKAIIRGHLDKNKEPISIRQKEFWDITQSSRLLSDSFSKMVSHEIDGLIFQPSDDPYVAGRCDKVLKWKPITMNSIDFKLKIGCESGEGIKPEKIGYLYVVDRPHPLDKIRYTSAIKHLDNKIIECKYENNQWVFMRERTDKLTANAFATAKGVVESIKNPVTTDGLLSFIKHKGYKDDSSFKRPLPPSTSY